MNESKAWDKMFYFQDLDVLQVSILIELLKLLKPKFHCTRGVLEIRVFQWGTFTIEILCLLIIHRILWSRNCMKSGKGWHLYLILKCDCSLQLLWLSNRNGKYNMHKQMKWNNWNTKCNKWDIMWCCNSLHLVYG